MPRTRQSTSSSSVDRVMWSRSGTVATMSRGRPRTVRNHAAITRRRSRPGEARRGDETTSSSSSPRWAITCTSISPARRVTRATNDPWIDLVPAAATAGAQHELGGLLPPGEGDERLGRVVTHHLVHGPAELDDESSLRGQRVGVARGQTVVDGDVHSQQLPADTSGHPRRTPDQGFSSGDAGDAHHDPSRASPMCRRCHGRRGSCAATPRPDPPTTAGRVREARRGCPDGSSCPAPRRRARPDRCCHGPFVDGSPRAPCRPVRAGRRGGRSSSGTVSRWVVPVMRETTSFSDSRCWMFTVEITSIPASSSCSTSCQRFSFFEPGALVCAYSSTRTTSGRRARTASRSISCSTAPR